ncbi:iron-siderophore ABC transporter substrate-binding protein [Pleurocapsales cyanobacterium LEGE 06147]|nr:iron-siderophore ABC transporter substrate-binding protein [Pleurocapsales cyanobacterium LEGE 06147]
MSKLRRLLITGICIVTLIVACDRPPNSLKSDLATSTNSESCRLVSHEMGETEVCGQPQKVAALSPHILDIILALGVQPAGFAQSVNSKLQTYDNPASQIPYLGKWVTTKPMALGSVRSPSLERLTQLQPDLILGEDVAHEDEYPLLTQIAPTLLFSDAQNPDEIQSWQQNIEGIARALGREERVQDLLTAHDRQIAQARTALQPVLQAYPRVLVIASNLRATDLESQPESTVGRLLREIGFKIVRPPGFADSRATISWEIVPKIETDLIIVMTWSDDLALNPEDTMPEAAMQEKWAQNPLLNSMPVFHQGRVFFVDYYLWSGVTRGPVTDQLILEALPDLLLDSVKKAGGAEEAEEAALCPLCFKKNA